MLVGLGSTGAWAAGSGAMPSWEDALEDKIPSDKKMVKLGKSVFEQVCTTCHGSKGDGAGAGEVYLTTKPRNFVEGQFKVRTTPSGSVPTDEDLFRSISVGFPEYGMPRFGYLSTKERWALVYYIETLSPRFADEDEYEDPIDLAEVPVATAEAIAQGKAVFELLQCGTCHGKEGRGDGPSVADLKTDAGLPSRPPDFTQRRNFKRGHRARDILYTLTTGMDGSPMPSYADSATPEQSLAVAHYIASLSRE